MYLNRNRSVWIKNYTSVLESRTRYVILKMIISFGKRTQQVNKYVHLSKIRVYVYIFIYLCVFVSVAYTRFRFGHL